MRRVQSHTQRASCNYGSRDARSGRAIVFGGCMCPRLCLYTSIPCAFTLRYKDKAGKGKSIYTQGQVRTVIPKASTIPCLGSGLMYTQGQVGTVIPKASTAPGFAWVLDEGLVVVVGMHGLGKRSVSFHQECLASSRIFCEFVRQTFGHAQANHKEMRDR
eukprot:1139077-Pelagomonas_calceolata.AAC.7